MNQDDLNFTSAAQLYNLKPHEQINNLFDPNITSTEDINNDLNKSSDDEIQFVTPSPVDINHMINYATVKNTSHNTQTWVNAISKYFKDMNLSGDITQIKDRIELENILIQFFVALKRKDGKLYAPTSIYNSFCEIARHLQINSCQDPKPNILDKNQFPCLFATIDGKIKLVQDTNPQDTPTSITYRVYFWLCLLGGLRGGDVKRLKFNHVKVSADKSLKITIPHEKNHAGGLKNLRNAGRVCQIPPDMHEKFTPVSDISYYIFRRGTYFKSEEFFLQIASDSGVVNMNHKKITNHSLRRSAIQILTQLNVTTDRIIAFSRHRSLGEVASYQTFTKEIMNSTVSMIIPKRDSKQDSNQDSGKFILDILLISISISNFTSLPVDHHPIQPKIFKSKPFKPYDASKPFISPVKKSKENVQENIQGNTQESPLHSNSNPIESAPKVIIENCKDCNIDIKISFNK
ncbi:4026_t:CDS:2 [Gigaspora margarita]|uniref:4026_t:CDS:1 n=1 Tax=Gigaspora margarita TaxID=4874 RepID=A0ABN7VMA4_GIGMA|nr:4026_t:CDS:2 [Gigaspora margarita]